MDLYTSRFGKLQKQKEMAISQVARERQKIMDQNNAAIRRGLGKGQANMDLYGSVLKNGGRSLINASKVNPEEYSLLQKGKFQNKVKISSNTVDYKTGDFLRNSKTIDKEIFDEFVGIFPHNNDIRRIEQENFVEENAIDGLTYIINGQQEGTDPRVEEYFGPIRNGVEHITNAWQAGAQFLGFGDDD